jgi:hypothetical protein
VAVLLFTFALRGSVGFGGAISLPLLALVIPPRPLPAGSVSVLPHYPFSRLK